MNSSSTSLTLDIDDVFSQEAQKLALNAKQVLQFFQNQIAPKLSDSAEEREQFSGNPFQYLLNAGCPVISDLSDQQKQSFNEIVSEPAPSTFPEDAIGCWICTKALEVAIGLIVVIGMLIVALTIDALAIVLAPYTGGISLALILITSAGFAIGVYVFAPMIERLATEGCKAAKAC
jgi:hypothetical protein